METIKIQYHNGQVKEIDRLYTFGQSVPAMVILESLNKQGHGIQSVTITAK